MEKNHTLSEENHDALVESARVLLEKLEEGESEEAMKIIGELYEERDSSLYYEIGRLTRLLHSAISNFHIDMKLPDTDEKQISRLKGASDRLDYVITLTENAANKTLDKVESAEVVARDFEEGARAILPAWKRLKATGMSPEEFRSLYKEIDVYLGSVVGNSSHLHEQLTDILLAQDFQDLSGQVLRRVIALVTEIEDNLVDLVKMASAVEAIAGVPAEDPMDLKDQIVGEGPIINAEERVDVMADQDEVDELLSSLGF